jgi:tripartite-type tricarboxylate transporter receptor subunit TctC
MHNRVILALAVIAAAAFPAHADPLEDFYKGRTITVLIGYSPGGSYDTAGRVLARYMGRYIPGNPSLLPQNMPGAGTLNLVNYLYNVSPKDGTTFGIFARGMAMEPLIGGTNAKFDATKLTWIGSAANEISLCATYQTSPVKTWTDALTKEFTVAGNGSGSDPDVFANVLRNRFGVKNRLISGYPGSAEISLAMERGEIDGRCGGQLTVIKSTRPQWLTGHKISVPILIAEKRSAEFPDTPTIMEFVKDEATRQQLELLMVAQNLDRPVMLPPGVPAARVEELRQAFEATMADADFHADVERKNLHVEPVRGADMAGALARAFSLPADVIAGAREMMGGR